MAVAVRSLPKTRPVLQLDGFSATVDALALERRDQVVGRSYRRIWFLSLLGHQQSVKAIWARLLKHEVATVNGDASGVPSWCALATEETGSWHLLTASLPGSAGYHGMLVPTIARATGDGTSFLLLPRAQDDVAALHYTFLNRRLDLPLHPSWAAWLWTRALRHGDAEELDAVGVSAYHCQPDVEVLAHDLCAAVKAGVLRVADTHAPSLIHTPPSGLLVRKELM